MLKIYLVISVISAMDIKHIDSIEIATMKQCAAIRDALVTSYIELVGGYNGTTLMCVSTDKNHKGE
tara:strand:+ start:2188 stop:2385 length:198 start_codon:yes stop_codon:yes gene_type:complete